MGQYSTHIDYYGVELPENLDEDTLERLGDFLRGSTFYMDGNCKVVQDNPENEHPLYALEVAPTFDGANLEIHDSKWVVVFKKYTKSYELDGDRNGCPTTEEINDLRNFFADHSLPWSEPKREEFTFID